MDLLLDLDHLFVLWVLDCLWAHGCPARLVDLASPEYPWSLWRLLVLFDQLHLWVLQALCFLHLWDLWRL